MNSLQLGYQLPQWTILFLRIVPELVSAPSPDTASRTTNSRHYACNECGRLDTKCLAFLFLCHACSSFFTCGSGPKTIITILHTIMYRSDIYSDILSRWLTHADTLWRNSLMNSVHHKSNGIHEISCFLSSPPTKSYSFISILRTGTIRKRVWYSGYRFC